MGNIGLKIVGTAKQTYSFSFTVEEEGQSVSQ